MQYKGFTLDQFQVDSIKAIENNNSVVVSAPTGSGKTLIADYIINKDLKKGIRVIYTAPIKALSNQKYREFTDSYGEGNIGLLTGDIVKNPEAPILIMTTEIYRNMALTNDPFLKEISYVIFDEIHYINDVERGYVWEESIIFSQDQVRFLCLSATIPNADEFASWIQEIKKHPVKVIHHDKRNVPLEKHFFDAHLGITSLKQINEVKDIPEYPPRRMRGRKQRRPRPIKPSHIELVRNIQDKVPCFFFTFSRAGCQKNAEELAQKKFFKPDPQIVPIIRKKLSQVTPDINKLKSTQILKRTLPLGIGFHHAGLLPIIKELVEELFGKGLIKVLYTTETFAVGINMPAKTVCFEALRKYDGINFRFLNSKEYFQIAGRAGRRGIDKIGYSYAMIDRRDFDYKFLKKITDKDIDPIKSQFRLSVNTTLNLIKLHNEEEINKILAMNFHTFQQYGKAFTRVKRSKIYHTFDSTRRKLEKLGFIKDNKLTEKGEFSSRIYADEITTGEIFATNFYHNFNEYQVLMLIGALSYEPRERTIFKQLYPSKFTSDLKKRIRDHEYLRRDKHFRELDNVTAIVDLCYHGKTIFDILDNTSLLEGDIIRFLRQMLDRIGQIKKATEDQRLLQILESCQHLIFDCLADVDEI